jgi:hypothetical protein
VNEIAEDTRNPALLYLGTEFGLYISLNGGGEWKKFMTGLPSVRIDDILVHPRDNDLIVGTHGRSIYVIDDITPLQQLSASVMKTDAHLFDVRTGTQWVQDVQLGQVTSGTKKWRGENPPPGSAITYYLGAAATGGVKITITDVDGKAVRTLTGPGRTGLNRARWDLRGEPPPRREGAPPPQPGAQPPQGPPVAPGTYLVKLANAGKELVKPVIVEADIWLRQER